MPDSPFLICQFDKLSLSNIIRERFGADFPDIVQKPQINFAFNYLSELGAATILLETDYVDRDYLEDYSQYYVRCFSRYGERCARLHFFGGGVSGDELEVTHEGVRNGLMQDPIALQSKLNSNYLGFIVIKPIPRTFIGKSCLKVYPSIRGAKNKNIISREYKVNLFGMQLTVDSVAFQEQDKIVSACATTAIWSLLHAQKDTYRLQETPSASRITLAAINHIDNSANSFPNGGLTIKQITRAIDVYGLRTHQEEFSSDFAKEPFFDVVRYYINSGIPLMLGGAVYKIESGKTVYEGHHAVTILGYKENCEHDALYVHDDRFGPYARTLIRDVKQYLDELKVEKPNGELVVEWGVFFQEKPESSDDSQVWKHPKQFIVPDALTIATHPKVRIASRYISNTCKLFLEQLENYIHFLNDGSQEGAGVTNSPGQFDYSVKLEELTEFRERILKAPNVSDRYEILTTNTPKYVWLASFSIQGQEPFMEICFDATDIPQGDAVRHIVVYDEDWKHLADKSVESLAPFAKPNPNIGEHFYNSVIKHLTNREDDFWEYLDRTYGEPRAPKLVKASEVSQDELAEQDTSHYYGRVEQSISEALENPELGYVGIWVIGLDGALHLGKEENGRGHPTIAGFKSARISGEIKLTDKGWKLIAKSGRYSGDYGDRQDIYLTNAKMKFLEIFGREAEDNIVAEPYNASID